MKKSHLPFYLVLLVGIVLLVPSIFSQEPEFEPAIIQQPMPDFTLPSYQGAEVTLSSLKGKNVLIMFPRGYAAEGHWCSICNYKYIELAELEKREQLRKKYNLEILYVLPYGKDVIKQWLEFMPAALEKIKGYKYPAEPDKLDEKAKKWSELARKLYPGDLSVEKGEVPTPFPILMDADRKVTKALGLFVTEWGGSKVDQLIPSEFIIDKNGVLMFKYVGQNTLDRPDDDYLMKMVELIDKMK